MTYGSITCIFHSQYTYVFCVVLTCTMNGSGYIQIITRMFFVRETCYVLCDIQIV
jgi:hypothetical protein